MWWAVAIILVILLHIIFPKKYNSLSFEWKISKIPGPIRVPYFGNPELYVMRPEKLIDFVDKLYKKYSVKSKPFKVVFLGHIYVILTDLDDIKTILNGTDHITKSAEYKHLIPWLGTGLLTSYGEKWRNHRKWLTPAFHFEILQQYMDTINKNANVLVKQLMTHVQDEYVDIIESVSLCTLDIICETAMGVTIGAQEGGEKELVKATLRMGHLFYTRGLSPWLRTDWSFDLYPTGREQKKVLSVLHGFTERVIKERRATYQQRQTKQRTEVINIGRKEKKMFLDLLIEMSETQNKMTEEEIREEVDTFMFEGHDTTSAGICWALHLLGSHPEIQEEAYKELEDIFGNSNRDPTNSDLVEMKYLERVIKESLRLYPSVPVIGRKLEVDIQIKNYTIPAGADVAISAYSVHRDEKYYPDPLKFDPDRFLPEAILRRHPNSYIPFSAGPRNCIGQRFAMMELKVILSQVLRKFRITSLDPPENIKLLWTLVLRPKESLRIAFKPRIFKAENLRVTEKERKQLTS